jgi:hypothetical protein
MHCGEAQGDTMEACVRMLYCSAVQSSVDEFRSQDFGLKLNWEAPMGSDLVYSILSPEWNADKTRVDKVRYWTAVARLFHRNRFVQVGVYGGRLDLVTNSSHNTANVGCLAGFV